MRADPFHYGGVTKNSSALLARDITALMVAGGSHCADMGPLNPERDSASMASVKRSKAAAIARWLSESPDAAARHKADDGEATGSDTEDEKDAQSGPLDPVAMSAVQILGAEEADTTAPATVGRGGKQQV